MTLDPAYLYDDVTPRMASLPAYTAYVKIAEGCDRPCSFCIIPQLRGGQRSRTPQSIELEVRELVERGAVEINLVAQDLGHWGRDLGLGGPKLPDLLETLLRETSVPWFRLLYVYSAGINERLVELIARESRIVPYIDMPIQHATDRMLERMRRPEPVFRREERAAQRRRVEQDELKKIVRRVPDPTQQVRRLIRQRGTSRVE